MKNIYIKTGSVYFQNSILPKNFEIEFSSEKIILKKNDQIVREINICYIYRAEILRVNFGQSKMLGLKLKSGEIIHFILPLISIENEIIPLMTEGKYLGMRRSGWMCRLLRVFFAISCLFVVNLWAHSELFFKSIFTYYIITYFLVHILISVLIHKMKLVEIKNKIYVVLWLIPIFGLAFIEFFLNRMWKLGRDNLK